MFEFYILTSEVMFYPETKGYGYRIYARTIGEPYLILISPGKYAEGEIAYLAGQREIQKLRSRLQARDIRMGIVCQQNGAA